VSPHPLDDAMAARVLVARWVIQGTLRLETAMHLGGERSDRTDMPILRDPVTGRPLLPGTTLAGALRNALADHLVGYGDTEPKEVAVLFGGARGDKDGSQSPLIVFDGLGELPPGYGVEIRDGVAIDPATGLAEDSKKYDYEVLPPGTLFPVRVDLLVPPDGADEEAGSAELRNLEYLAAALGALSRGEHSFGARRSRGLGTVRATWSAQRFPLDSRKGWLEWAGTAHEEPWPREPSHSCIREVLEKVMSMPLTRPVDARRRVVFELSVAPVNDILVRTPGTGPAEPDAVHLRSGGEPILPGTGLAGVMRAQALRIAKLVRKDLGDADYWISRLFGPRFQGRRPKPGHQASGSRLRVGEAALEDTATRRQTRVAIDRFTQGTVNGALFDEQIETGGHATLQLELRNPKEGEVGLVLLVLKDLLDGRLPVGGTSSVGRGFLHGTAVVTWHDGAGRPPRSARVEPGQTPIGEAADDINKAITALHEAAHLPEVNPPEHTTTSSRGRHMSDAEATAVQHIAGCTIEPIENADCEAYLSWLLGRKG